MSDQNSQSQVISEQVVSFEEKESDEAQYTTKSQELDLEEGKTEQTAVEKNSTSSKKPLPLANIFFGCLLVGAIGFIGLTKLTKNTAPAPEQSGFVSEYNDTGSPPAKKIEKNHVTKTSQENAPITPNKIEEKSANEFVEDTVNSSEIPQTIAVDQTALNSVNTKLAEHQNILESYKMAFSQVAQQLEESREQVKELKAKLLSTQKAINSHNQKITEQIESLKSSQGMSAKDVNKLITKQIALDKEFKAQRKSYRMIGALEMEDGVKLTLEVVETNEQITLRKGEMVRGYGRVTYIDTHGCAKVKTGEQINILNGFCES